MAAVQNSRARSARVGAPAVPPAPASRRPLSIHGRPPAAASTTPSAAPNQSIPTFLTNLRLLDLDLREDWPDVTPATFAGTTQNHKRRVQAVEWALYRLFEIWDPEDTASKLKPYFPAVDQLQSVSLRAALLRGLENAKKSGALGRDALIRKTMLDDCKGERLEEVLAAFSSAVLRSTVADRRGTRPLAVDVALEDRGYQGDGHLLRPLIIAHRVSLKHALDRRRQAGAAFSDFGELLAMKERGITRRNEMLRANETAATHAAALAEDTRRRVRQTVKNNWSGHEAWMDTLLAGDAAGRRATGLLGTPYDRVWRRVQQGRLAELEDDDRGMLLQQLDGRVEAQRLRLARWDELRRDMAGGGRGNKRPASPLKKRAAPKKPPKGIDLQFNAHADLHVRAMLGMRPPTHEETLHGDYATMMDELDLELTELKTTSFENAVQRLHTMRAQYGNTDTSVHLASDPISELSDLGDMDEDEDDIHPAPYVPPSRHTIHRGTASRLPSRPASMYAPDPSVPVRHRPAASERSYSTPYSEDGYSSASTSRQPSSSHIGGTLRQQFTDGGESASSPPTSGSLAEHATARSISPSPSKSSSTKAPRHTLSLAERTRMSMARRSMQFFDDEAPELRGAAPAPAPRADDDDDDDDDMIADLASRTRMSMAGFEKAQQRARTDRQREMRRELKRARALPPRREGSQWAD
ncbi:hypothetical protein A9K55_000322 [Cordyceps militaris]|uniref:HAUS augmin-like complex subunit 6 N-terminal domain-containing protein n=1 Tax=Cordyceps militaris TaxID=73501 RepID=A0A2H4SW61_CORMI|nr:hypothetical protein A9K55_000322 [Cordyceps militaris]